MAAKVTVGGGSEAAVPRRQVTDACNSNEPTPSKPASGDRGFEEVVAQVLRAKGHVLMLTVAPAHAVWRQNQLVT